MRPRDHKRRILDAERAWSRSEGLLRALVERGVYIFGGLTHRPGDAQRPPPDDSGRTGADRT